MQKYCLVIGTPKKCCDLCTNLHGMPARFYEQEVKSKLKDKRALSAYLDTLANRYKKGLKKVQLTYIFCSDDYLLGINKEFLNHDTLTDIVTFDMTAEPNTLTGEIYISIERVAENAEKFGVDYINELHRVIFHGALHLCGFKDKKKEDKELMRKKEDESLAAYFKN
jgi:probable rRNA maturation factor